MILSLSLSSSGYYLLEKWWQKVITVLSAPGYVLEVVPLPSVVHMTQFL